MSDFVTRELGTRTEPLRRREPVWMQEADYVRDTRADEREARMQQMEDEQPRPSYGTATGGNE